MNRKSFVLCLAIATGVVSCNSSTESESGLIGSWISTESLSPSGHMTTQLSFAGDGTFTDAIRTFGVYPGQSRNDLSSYTIMSGTYTTDGDQLESNVSRVETWDRFHGADSPPTVRNVNTTVFDQGRFRISGFSLTLDYLTFPADAPVPTTKAFIRTN